MPTVLQCMWIVAGYSLGWLMWDMVPKLIRLEMNPGKHGKILFGLITSLAVYTLTEYPLRYLWDR